MGDTIVVAQEIYVVEFRQESKFLFIIHVLRPRVTP
jgi:hypothetical protein